MILLDQAYLQLLKAAQTASLNAYAPYTKQGQGAAILTADGSIICGATVEIASYSNSVSAEIAAVCQAVAQGHHTFRALAIEPFSLPSGNARQFLAEFGIHLELIKGTPSGYEIIHLKDLLPHHFGPVNIEYEKSLRIE